MSLKIFNTLSGEKEDFVPLTPGEVRMYVCGVTVYDSSHIGHARSLLTFDTIYRYLKFSGYRVQFVRNFTDVDDKIINKANDQKSSCETITDRYIDEFHRDAESLGLLAPSLEPRATVHIAEIIELIQKLEERQLAYRIDGDVFFSVPGFPGYGKLSRKRIEELEAGARVEIDERKKSPLDFALWKSSKAGEPSWESPWGPGRPGWHIECSAMSSKYLGQPFDIHGGGRDLMFPHHENEIAQSEGAFGLPLARYWMHNGLLTVNGEKMSKSLGNYFTIIYETIERIACSGINRQNTVADASLMSSFCQEMNDDFNTPRALALIFDEVRSLNRLLDAKQNDGIAERASALETMCEALGLLQDGPEAFFSRKKARWLRQQGFAEEEVQKAIAVRDEARMNKDWREADRIRNELLAKGIVVEDTRGGTTWKVR
ncbi:MAG: Cysteinyl-tRNA synthetase [Deltaproteobacteria bacterium]|nr:Cysteinyl-tRNA synthetase [Deltaproteobacteria bacterium]